jgi:hypothetical protein
MPLLPQVLVCPSHGHTTQSLVCIATSRSFFRGDSNAMQDLIKYDTPYLGPRIQLMLSQLEFKLNVEQQYLKGIEKMVQLYQMEGDKKSRADAAGRRIESTQKIQILKQALKRYEDLHIDIESAADANDGMFSANKWRSSPPTKLCYR